MRAEVVTPYGGSRHKTPEVTVVNTIKNLVFIMLFILLAGVFATCVVCGKAAHDVSEGNGGEEVLQDIHDQVAVDSVEQYRIAKRNGDAVDACVHAGMVAAAYLQAKDETNYQKWKDIERADCDY